MTKRLLPLLFCMTISHIAFSQSQPRHHQRRMAFSTDTVMAHDPVMAYENGTYHLLSTGMGIQWATSKDRKTWVMQPTPFIEQIPQWTHDSVPGFRNHVWAPDIIRWHNRWWLAYSCSTFGKNTSAIGLMSASSLTGQWKDEGCIVKIRIPALFEGIIYCFIFSITRNFTRIWTLCINIIYKIYYCINFHSYFFFS